MDDYSVFYYTYSTIAQTLASAFGFLAAVVLYQLQEFSVWIDDNIQSLLKAADQDQRLSWMDRGNNLVARRNRLLKALGRAMAFTAATVILCFVLLPLTNKSTWFGNPSPAWSCLGVTVSLAIACVFTYWPLVKSSVFLKPDTTPPPASLRATRPNEQ
jgi:hypothetical protein